MDIVITLIGSVVLGSLGYIAYSLYRKNKAINKSILSRLPKDLHFELCKYLYTHNHNYLNKAQSLPEIDIILKDPSSYVYKFYWEYYVNDIDVYSSDTDYEKLLSDFVLNMSFYGGIDKNSMVMASIKYRCNKVLLFLLDDVISDKVSVDVIAYHYLSDNTDVKIKEILYKYMLSQLSFNEEDLNRYLGKIISRGQKGEMGPT